MDNTKRRAALDKARTMAMRWANQAEDNYPLGSAAHKDCVDLANMWSNVANAMKVGDERADNVI